MNLIKLFIGLIIYFFLILLKPLINLRFGFVYSSRIGHLAFNIDHCLTFTGNKKRQIIFLGFQKNIANKYLLDTWKKSPGIIFTNKLMFIFNMLNKINQNSPFIISYKTELHPIFSTTSLAERNLQKIDDKENTLEKFLKTHNINSPFVCINNRDNEYLKKNKMDDGNYHEFRNFKIDTFSKTIDYLIEKNYFVIRIGEHKKNDINIENKKFIDLGSYENTKLLELILLERCFLYIGGNTGISAVSRLFRKPILLINYTPFNIREMSAWSAYSNYIPKKLKNRSTKKLLTFKEMNNLKYDIHFQGNFFEENNIEVVDNSSDEILKATVEMESKLNNIEIINNSESMLQSDFWNELSDVKDVYRIRNELKLNISNSFLIDHKNLIK
jgi:putative glycosyltransferase (TIGR04372 family)